MSQHQDLIEIEKPRKKLATVLWTRVRQTSSSSNAIARVVHPRSSRRWSEAEDSAVLEAFEAANKLAPATYTLSGNKARASILQAVSLKVGRSPKAVRIRLNLLGADVSRQKAPPSVKDLRSFIASKVSSFKA